MRSIILHGHLFKNAGSTFDWSLRRSFADGFLDHRDDTSMRDGGSDFLRSLIAEDPALVAISSHVMPLMESTSREFKLFPVYFLRHPILRVRSVYDFELRQTPAMTPGAIEAKRKNFREYVEWRLDEKVGAIIRNYHSRYLGGLRRRGASSKGDQEDYVKATQTLENIMFSPVVESYDISMVLLEEILKPNFPKIDLSYIAQNVTRKKDSSNIEKDLNALKKDLGDIYTRLVSANEFDLCLYKKGIERLNAMQKKTFSFNEKLSNFINRCKKLGEEIQIK